jgi:PmbA protein
MESLYSLRKKLLEKGVDDVVLQKITSDQSMIKFVNNKIVKVGTESDDSVEIFVAKDKKLVTTSLKDFDDISMNNVVKRILEFLKTGKKNHSYVGLPEGKFKYPEVKNFDKKVEELDSVEIVKTSIDKALEKAKRVSGTFESSKNKVSILTSKDIERTHDSTHLYLSLRALATKEASGHKTVTSSTLRKFNFENAGEQAGEIAKASLNPEEGKSGQYDVVFSPLAFAPILDNVGDATSIFNVEFGLSFFKDKLGKKIGDINLIDDGTLNNGVGSSVFDDEGHPTQRTEIIKDGFLKTYLHNYSTAKRHGVESTGNAGIIAPSSTNIILEGKEGNPFNIDNGIYITNVWYTRFQNYLSGDFSVIPRDGMFIIKKGEITKPIKNLRVSENVINMLKNIELFGKEKEQITSWEANTPCHLAPILIKDVRLTKPEA